MDEERKDSNYEPKQSNITRSERLNYLKHQANIQSERITFAQQEIEQLKPILSEARRRLETMKKRKS